MVLDLNAIGGLPAGHHIITIQSVTVDEKMGKLTVKMETDKGKKRTDTYFITNQRGERNDAVMNRFSYFVKAVMGDMNLPQIDTKDLVGRVFETDVEIVTVEKDGKSYTNNNLTNIKPYKPDLSSILGDDDD